MVTVYSHPHPRGYGTWDTELRDLQQLADALPCGWFHAAATAVQSQPTWTSLSADMYNVSRRLPSAAEQQLELALVSRLGWRQWSLGKPILLCSLTVKTATSLQLGPLRTTRKQKFQQFASEALHKGLGGQPGWGPTGSEKPKFLRMHSTAALEDR